MSPPWYVTAYAVQRYIEARRVPLRRKGRATVAGVALDFADAIIELQAYATATWQRHLGPPPRPPALTRTGAFVYRGPGPLRLHLVISPPTPHEPLGQLIDVVPTHAGMSR